MTKAEWIAEVTAAVAASASPLTVFTAHVEQSSPMCYAEVTDDKRRRIVISIARDRFSTAAARRDEILRQIRQVGRT